MPDPHDTLAVFAEVAVTLAGLSGIAIAFGHRSTGALSQLESRRLINLFTFSGLVLTLSLLSMALLNYEWMDASMLWRGGSAVLVYRG